MQLLRPWLAVLICVLTLFSTAPSAQTPQPLTGTAQTVSTAPDYDAWRSFAQNAEQVLDQRALDNEALDELRAELVTFRARFLSAQDTNHSRIANLREQIAALGPPPEEGASEAAEIAERRTELAEQLTELQAPGIAAQEAFRRADGLIRQVDTIRRERDAEALLSLSPSPVNPVNWVVAADAIWGRTFTFLTQVIGATEDPARMREFRSNLPVSLALLVFGFFILWRGRRWIEGFVSNLLDDSASRRNKRLLARLMSLAQIIVPVTGLMALIYALRLTSLFGDIGSEIASGIVTGGIAYFVARWAGGQIFQHRDSRSAPLQLPAARRREGRFWANLIGLALGLHAMLVAFVPREDHSDAVNAVIVFPVTAFSGLVLFRIGMLLNQHNTQDPPERIDTGFFDRMVPILGKIVMAVGIGAPVFAAIGYVRAAEALLFPTIVSLGLIVVLLFLMQVEEDVYAVVTDADDAQTDTALVPSLINFALVLASLPVFALIWGARPSELLEFWQVFSAGFSIGETRISPTNIISFLIIFAIGYTITRIIQGALETSLLPKTTIDKGGQKAIISGTGYIGIFVAALVAISTAGIDLSGLAIVAGALSVGIGFGLQNIVSNFISGLILLIERPVAEGDWIEVGSTMGTVRSISVRSTVIETFDRTDVIVPNADLISGTVTNWTRYNSQGRIIIPVGVAYGSDTRKVARILQEIAENEPLALLDPSPQVHFVDFGADSLDFEVRMILSDVGFGLSVRTELRHQIAERFKEEGIEIPFAQRDIWLRNPEALRGEPPAVPQQQPAEGKTAERTKMRYNEIDSDAGGDSGGDDPDGSR